MKTRSSTQRPRPRSLLAWTLVGAMWTWSCFAAGPAVAGQPMPHTANSYYMYSTSSSRAYDLGCRQGTYDATHGNVDSEIILDFWKQVSTQSSLGPHKIAFGKQTIETLAEHVAAGYYNCTGEDTRSLLTLAIGTSTNGLAASTHNDLKTARRFGQGWAGIVSDVAAWSRANPCAQTGVGNCSVASQVRIFGASDMELSWASASLTRAWVDGFSSTGVCCYINYGDAAGCPPAGDRCNNGYSQSDVYYISWVPAMADLPVPEIYYNLAPKLPINAQQWRQLSSYGHFRNAPGIGYGADKIIFGGPLTQHEYDKSNSASGAWTAFSNELNAHAETAQQMLYSDDIEAEP